MALSSRDVIESQPLASDTALQHQKFDDEGELIVFEGVCWCEGLKKAVKLCYCSLSITTYGLGLPLFYPLGIFCANKACDVWQLYLTSKSLCFVQFNVGMAYCPGSRTVRIALTDIEAIQAQTRLVRAGCCNYGLKIGTPTTIHIELREGAKSEFSLKCCFVDLPTVIAVHYCDNADEFVAAVKKQMGIMVRE